MGYGASDIAVFTIQWANNRWATIGHSQISSKLASKIANKKQHLSVYHCCFFLNPCFTKGYWSHTNDQGGGVMALQIGSSLPISKNVFNIWVFFFTYSALN